MSRDYLIFSTDQESGKTASKIGKNEDKSGEKVEKKEKKAKAMSDSRIRKWRKLFGQQISSEEKLLEYYSCALVADILLQGYLYISENYFSFYSNVFGFITKLIIPIDKVEKITKEKTAKFFPNAIALHLAGDSRHVFGSFLSREAAYQLMSLIHKKTLATPESSSSNNNNNEGPHIVESVLQDIEISSLEESSSISGSEGPLQLPVQLVTNEIEVRAATASHQDMTKPTANDPPMIPSFIPSTSENVEVIKPVIHLGSSRATNDDHLVTSSMNNDEITEPVARLGNYNVKLMNEFNILYFGICLAILLAIFTGVLFFKINAIEKRQNMFSNPITFEEAENILKKNLVLVKTVRRKLEELHEILDNSIENMPNIKNEL